MTALPEARLLSVTSGTSNGVSIESDHSRTDDFSSHATAWKKSFNYHS